jgi:hypothetical protein
MTLRLERFRPGFRLYEAFNQLRSEDVYPVKRTRVCYLFHYIRNDRHPLGLLAFPCLMAKRPAKRQQAEKRGRDERRARERAVFLNLVLLSKKVMNPAVVRVRVRAWEDSPRRTSRRADEPTSRCFRGWWLGFFFTGSSQIIKVSLHILTSLMQTTPLMGPTVQFRLRLESNVVICY